MANRRLLFLDSTRLSAHRWAAGQLHLEGRFAPDAAGLDAFTEYIRRERRSLFYILADLAEEGFQIEDVPFTQGRDRAALIKRKLSQYFYGTPYALAMSLGRQKEGRRDERMLYTALTRPPQVEPWLTALRAAEGQLAGLFSVPLVLAEVPLLLGSAQSRHMVLSAGRAGVRQTLIDDGRVIFSRLTPLVTGSTEEMALTCAAEAEKMYQYMVGQRLIVRGSQITTHLLVHPAQAEAFRVSCVDSASIHFEFVDLLQISARLGFKTPPENTFADTIFLHVLARKPPAAQFAPDGDRRFFRLGQIGLALRAVGVTLFAACLLFVVRQFVDYRNIVERSTETASQTATDRSRYDAMLAALPPVPLTNDQLRALVERYEHVLAQSDGPKAFFIKLSQALQESPRIDLLQLDWALGNKAGGGAGMITASPGTTAPAAPAPPGRVRESIELHAHLPLDLANDPRGQRSTVDAFVDRLRARGLHVQVLKHSFEADSAKSIKSGADDHAQVQPPRFSLRIMWMAS